MQGIFSAFTDAQKAGQEFGQDIQSKNILAEAYAGTTPQDVAADPLKQQSVLQQAAVMAGQKGLNSLSYSFNKQAGELSKDVKAQQLNNIKYQQGVLEYAGQLLPAASSDADLTNAFAGVKDPAAQMQIQAVIKSDKPIEQKKQILTQMTQTVEQHLRAQSLLGSAEERQDRMDARDERLLSTRIQNKIRTGAELTPEEQNYFDYGVTPWDSKRAAARGSVATGTAPAGKTEEPVSVRQNNPLNVTDPKTGKIRSFDTPEEGREAGLRDLQSKIAGTSQAYKDKFGNQPVTPERLAETWSPAGAKGNSKESTANYAKAIADAAGIKVNETIENTTQTRDKVFKAMSDFEAGAYKPTASKEPATADEKLTKQYDEKRGGGLTIKEWDTINPTAVQIGKEYKVKPTNLASATTDEKKAADSAYQVTKLAEKNAEFIKEHPEAVGTLAAIFKSAAGKTGNLADNVSADKRYSGAVAELGKRLFALGLKDAAASAGGRMNVYLEKSFASLYDQSQSDRTLLRIIKARQDEAFDVLNNTYGADKENLNKDQYKLAFAPDADTYVGKGKKATADKPTADINSFFFNNQKNQ
jgi:hypothetical protein